MNKELIGGSIGTILSATGTALSTNEILETISLVLTIIGATITFVIIPLINWYKLAKKDGKITKEEVKEGLEIISKSGQEISEKIKKEK